MIKKLVQNYNYQNILTDNLLVLYFALLNPLLLSMLNVRWRYERLLQIVKIHFFQKIQISLRLPSAAVVWLLGPGSLFLLLSVEVKIKIFAENLENNIVYLGLIVYVKSFNRIISREQKSIEFDVAINLFIQFSFFMYFHFLFNSNKIYFFNFDKKHLSELISIYCLLSSELFIWTVFFTQIIKIEKRNFELRERIIITYKSKV